MITCCLVTSRGRMSMQWWHNNDYLGKEGVIMRFMVTRKNRMSMQQWWDNAYVGKKEQHNFCMWSKPQFLNSFNTSGPTGTIFKAPIHLNMQVSRCYGNFLHLTLWVTASTSPLTFHQHAPTLRNVTGFALIALHAGIYSVKNLYMKLVHSSCTLLH